MEKKTLIPIILASILAGSFNSIRFINNEQKFNNEINKMNDIYNVAASSSASGHEIEKLNDQDYTTYWEASNSEEQVIDVDLGEIRYVTRISQIFVDDDIWYFTVLGSVDNLNFYELVDYSFGLYGHAFDESCSGIARYIRLKIIKSEKGFTPTSKEFIVTSKKLSEGSNLSLGLSGESSSYSANYNSNSAFDGDYGTFWCASNGDYSQWLSGEWKENKYVKDIVVYEQDYGTYNFEIEGRLPDGSWIKLKEASDLKGISFKFEVNRVINAIVYRVFSGPGWASVKEIEVNGFEQKIVEEDGFIDLKEEKYINKIVTTSNTILGSNDNINYEEIKLNNGIVDKCYRYLKGIKTNDEIYTSSLSKNLAMFLSGEVSSFSDEAHSLYKATQSDNSVSFKKEYWQSETKGGEQTITLDLGRVCLVKSIYQSFNEWGIWKFKVETAVKEDEYQVVYGKLEGVEGQDFDISLENENFALRYVRLTIQASDDQYASSRAFQVIGNGSPMRENWWQNTSGVIRFYPKEQRTTLREITSRLDEFRYAGYRVIELHQPYEGLADIWAGLGATNSYQVDPIIGTLDDLHYLIEQAHKRGMRVFMFGNVGYGRDTSDYFKKACQDYALGINSKERNWFLFSDTCPDSSKWFWSETANAYYYAYWGENGQIPTYNFNNKEWQDETKKYISFWCDFGVDGIALDAPPVYYWGEANPSEVTYKTITNTMRKHNLFTLPEGTGDISFISNYYYSGVQNYGISNWGGNATSIGINAVRNESAKGLDDAIKSARDNAVALGGISIAGMNFEDNYDLASDNERILESALVTSTGHLAFLHLGSSAKIGQDIMQTFSLETQKAIANNFALQSSVRALTPSGMRCGLTNNNSSKYYTFYKSDMRNNAKVIAVFNYSSLNNNVDIDLSNLCISEQSIKMYDMANNEQIEVQISGGKILVPMKASSYRLLMIL